MSWLGLDQGGGSGVAGWSSWWNGRKWNWTILDWSWAISNLPCTIRSAVRSFHFSRNFELQQSSNRNPVLKFPDFTTCFARCEELSGRAWNSRHHVPSGREVSELDSNTRRAGLARAEC